MLENPHNVTPYYDNFDSTKNYLKLLFNPSKNLQASELSQLQSTLQNQISVQGSHLFESGAIVQGGESFLDTNITVLRLTSSSDVSVLNTGDIVQGVNSLTRGRVVVVDTELSNPHLFVKIIDGNDLFEEGEDLEIYVHETDSVVDISCTLDTLNFQNRGTLITINEGYMFYNGYFIYFETQRVIVSRTPSNSTTFITGMVVSDDIVTFLEDSDLLDPANGHENFGQDGAHRFRQTLTLSVFEDETSLPENFIELRRTQDNQFVNDERVDIYSDIEDNLARRTFDESGNYTVRPFKISIVGHAKINDLTANSYGVGQDNVSIFKSGSNELTLQYRRGSESINNNFEQSVKLQLEIAGNVVTGVASDSANIATTQNTGDIDFRDIAYQDDSAIWSTNGMVFCNAVSTEDIRNIVITLQNDIDADSSIRIRLDQFTREDTDTAYVWLGDSSIGTNIASQKEWMFQLIDSNTDSQIDVCLDAGKAYVQGYEFETISKSTVVGERARNTETVQNFGVGTSFGNYVTVNNLNGWFATDTFEVVHLLNDTTTSSPNASNIIGTANLRQIVSDGVVDEYRFYLFNIQMNFGENFSNVRSIYAETDLANSARCDISARSITNDRTNLQDSHLNSLIFPINQQFIRTLAPSGVSDITYNTRLAFNGTFNNGTLTINAGAGRQFVSGNNQLHFLVVDTTTGNIITPTFNFGSSPQTVTLDLTGFSGPVKILATVRVNTATQVNKTLIENFERVIDNGTAANFDLSTRSFFLKKSDGYRLRSVRNSSGDNITNRFTFDNGQKDDFYDHARLVLRNGQSVSTTEYPLTVSFDYFEHSGTGFFSVDSYGDIPYNLIPSFTSPASGQSFRLRDSIDFRPRREDDTDAPIVMDVYAGGIIVPANIGVNFLTSDYEFYLSRIDKVILTRDRQFQIIQGVPSLNPVSPKDLDNAMTLYTLTIPPFTNNPSDIRVRYHENKRYTMRQIGALEKRIENLEYYTTLSLLEKDTIATEVSDNEGITRFKNGIIVDSFTGHGIGDVGNADYRCSIDTQNQFMRAPFVSRTIEMSVVEDNDITIVGNGSTGQFATIPYTDVVYFSQTKASKIENVNPYLVVKYIGNANTNPAIDHWISQTARPDVVVNLEGNNDAIQFIQQSANTEDAFGFGTTWNDWETTWTGVEETEVTTFTPTETVGQVQTNETSIVTFTSPNRGQLFTEPEIVDFSSAIATTELPNIFGNEFFIRGEFFQAPQLASSATQSITLPSTQTVTQVPRTVTQIEQTGIQTRTGTRTTFSPNTITENIGTRIVDVSIVPFMRGRNIRFTANGLRPNRELNVFFDGVNVNEFIFAAPNGVPDSLDDNVQGLVRRQGLPLVTNSMGEVSGVFTIPEGVFRVGERELTLIDDPNNSKSAATTYATARYQASGLVQTVEDTIISTRTLEVTQEVVREERTISETVQPPAPLPVPQPAPMFFQDEEEDDNDDDDTDPLAQTFFINGRTFPNGMFISKVDLFFKTKSTSNVPIRLEIRPVINGFPSSSKIVPMSVIFKNPSDTVLSNDGSAATTFTWPVPIYLAPNAEYSLVVLADSQEYEVFVSELGQPDFITGNRISAQPHLGSLFKSQNARTWTPIQEEDLKMTLYRCDFNTSTNSYIRYAASNVANDREFCLTKFVSEFLDFSGTNVDWRLKTTNLDNSMTDFEIIENNKNTIFNTPRKIIVGDNESYQVDGTLSTVSSHVAPLIDLTRQYSIIVDNVINSTFVDEELSNNGQATAKYITRRVTLSENLDGNYLRVFLTAYKPDVTDIRVYYRVLSAEDNTDFDQRPYVLMEQETDAATFSTGQNDYKEFAFVPPTNEITYTDDNGVDFDTYKTFSIKVVMTSSNKAVVPRVKDLRAISTAP